MRYQYALFVLLSLILADMMGAFIFQFQYPFEIILGWFLALLFGSLNFVIKKFSFGKSIKIFFTTVLLVSPLTIAGLLWSAFFLMNQYHLYYQPFILSMIIAYFVLLGYHVDRFRFLNISTS